MAKNKSKGVQDTLIPDEITPLQLLPLSAAAGSVKKAASAFRVKASKLLECADKEEYIERYKGISHTSKRSTTPTSSRSASSTRPPSWTTS